MVRSPPSRAANRLSPSNLRDSDQSGTGVWADLHGAHVINLSRLRQQASPSSLRASFYVCDVADIDKCERISYDVHRSAA